MSDQPYDPGDDLLSEQTSDDTDRGWGEDWRAGSDREKDGDADLERFRREKPPHW